MNAQLLRALESDADSNEPQGSKKRNPCKDYGLCAARDGFCQAVDDATCQGSTSGPKWRWMRDGGVERDAKGFADCDGAGP